MNWSHIKPLMTQSNLSAFEQMVDFRLPASFKDCVIRYNGGRPEKRLFNTKSGREMAVKKLLSFNKEDMESVWNMFSVCHRLTWTQGQRKETYIPFAIDDFGNFICFDKSKARVFFVDHETGKPERVTDNFASFIASLHD